MGQLLLLTTAIFNFVSTYAHAQYYVHVLEFEAAILFDRLLAIIASYGHGKEPRS